jgi:hypothetical protein
VDDLEPHEIQASGEDGAQQDLAVH